MAWLSGPDRPARTTIRRPGVPGRRQGVPDPQNYDKGSNGVFNGTQGVVTFVNLNDATLTMRTEDDEDIDYDFSELDELTHAYAVTVHRAQGSEYPCVVMPLTTARG